MNFLEVSDGGRLVKYIGRGRDDVDAASVRSNAPLSPPPIPVGYFEATVVDCGRDGYMSIGLMNRRASLDRLVGWGEGAVGYHGDDGNLFCESGVGKAFGPLYTTGDIVGCGVNWIKHQVFFTKNGRLVGTCNSPFRAEDDVYAAIGLRTPGEMMRANFGQAAPFLFNIHQYFGELKASVVETYVNSTEIDDDEIKKLIIDHCLFHGYFDTIRALLGYTSSPKHATEYVSMINKRTKQMQIIDAILQGRHGYQDLLVEAFPEAAKTLINRGDFTFVSQAAEFANFVFEHPQNLREIIERADELKKVGEKFQVEFDLETKIYPLLAYQDPSGAHSAQKLLHWWRTFLASELDATTQFKDRLHGRINDIQDMIRRRREDSTVADRFWALLDDDRMWLIFSRNE